MVAKEKSKKMKSRLQEQTIMSNIYYSEQKQGFRIQETQLPSNYLENTNKRKSTMQSLSRRVEHLLIGKVKSNRELVFFKELQKHPNILVTP